MVCCYVRRFVILVSDIVNILNYFQWFPTTAGTEGIATTVE